MTIEAIRERAELLDAGALGFDDCSLIALTNLYLIASYAYYERNHSLLSDGTFDELCKYLYESFDFLAASGVWHVGTVIVEGNLKAGTCLGITYPPAIVEIAEVLVAKARELPSQNPPEEEYDI